MDYPYIVFYFLLTVMAYFNWKKPNQKIVKWSLVMTFLFIALRAPVVGADTWDYVRFLTGEKNYYNNDVRELESGFLVYRNIISSITSSRLIVMIVNSIFTLIPLLFLMKKFSYNVPLSILLFFYLGGLTHYCVSLRQCISFSIIILGLIIIMNTKYSITKKIFIGMGIVFVSYNMHSTSILYAFILLCSFLLPELKKSTYIVLIITSATIGIVMKSFDMFNAFNFFLSVTTVPYERVSDYMLNDEIYERTITVLLRPSILFLIFILFITSDKLSHPFCKISLMGCVIYNLFSYFPMIDRVCMPFFLFLCIGLTWIFNIEYYKYAKIRLYTNIIVVLIVAYFSRSIIIDNISYDSSSLARMHPYYFHFQYYMDHPSIKFNR